MHIYCSSIYTADCSKQKYFKLKEDEFSDRNRLIETSVVKNKFHQF